MLWVKRISIGLLILIVAFAVYGFWTVRRSFPQVQGELEIEGLVDEVEVLRDNWGVPHIYAHNPHDLFFAQGYTQAQDRFWQMDFWRHIGAGRLTEMFGESQVDADKFLRSLGFTALAEQELEAMDPGVREILEWYADGVNAYLAGHQGAQISLEYAVLPLQNSGYEIEPWTPLNTLTWAKMMAWDLGGNLRTEIDRAVLSKDLPSQRLDQLYPAPPEDHPVIVPSDQVTAAAAETPKIPDRAITAIRDAGTTMQGVWDITGGGFEGVGSNNWVVGGSLTASGKPLLANDTHLAIQMPSIWYENALHCLGDDPECPYQLIGFSFAGTPGVVIGHNEHITWGVTNEAADTQDLFIERVNPDNPEEYEVDGSWVPFETRTETLVVAGADDVVFEVMATRHGPVISETFLEEGELDDTSVVDLPPDYVVSLSWQALEPSTLVEAILGINRASNYEEFKAAMSKWDIAPQNLVYADVDGNIAYHSTGEIPVRAQGDGRHPVPGWTSDYEWTGLIPPEEMPYLLNPPRDYIATANQLVTRPGEGPLIGAEGDHGYRGHRIETLIIDRSPHTTETMREMQLDAGDGGAARLTPYLLELPGEGDDRVIEVQQLLSAWSAGADGFQSVEGSTGAAVFQATWRHLLANTFQDELPEDYWPVGGGRWFTVVAQLLESPTDPWWDDVTTADTEDRDQILHRSMADAHDELTELLGGDSEDWTWGKLHSATFENQTFGQSGIAPIEWLFNRSAPPRVGGTNSAINAVGWDTNISYVVDWVPSQRLIVDLSDLSASTFIHTTGQSGHAFHRNYDNMIEPWTDGEHAPMYWTTEEVAANAVSTLRLVPAD